MADIITPVTGDTPIFDMKFDFLKVLESLYNALLTYLGPLAGALVLIYIVWGGIRYMQAGGDMKKATEARNAIVAGVIGAAIIITAYTVILIGRSLGQLFNSQQNAPTEFQSPTSQGANQGQCLSVNSPGTSCSSKDSLGQPGGFGCTCSTTGQACTNSSQCTGN